MNEQPKRNIAYKLRIGDILSGKPIIEEDNRLKHLEFKEKAIIRINLIANVIDKYIQDEERKFGTLTLDDGSGQIKVKLFGDEIEKLAQFNQGDTIVVIGTLRTWNNELYINPELIKKKDSAFLLVRKLELESETAKNIDEKTLFELKDKILLMIKEAEKNNGIDIEEIIATIKEKPDIINQEIKKLIEEGTAYEPRPGRLRYLG